MKCEIYIRWCLADLGHDNGHGEVLGMRCDVTEHHNSGQTDVTTRVANVVDHCGHSARVHYQLSQLNTRTQTR